MAYAPIRYGGMDIAPAKGVFFTATRRLSINFSHVARNTQRGTYSQSMGAVHEFTRFIKWNRPLCGIESMSANGCECPSKIVDESLGRCSQGFAFIESITGAYHFKVRLLRCADVLRVTVKPCICQFNAKDEVKATALTNDGRRIDPTRIPQRIGFDRIVHFKFRLPAYVYLHEASFDSFCVSDYTKKARAR